MIPNKQLCIHLFYFFLSRYFASVAEVLDSVQKTEESLRRLKKARDRSSNIVPNDRRVEDDNKIRLQLLLDVNAFVQGVSCTSFLFPSRFECFIYSLIINFN